MIDVRDEQIFYQKMLKRKIVALILENPYLSANEMANRLHLSRRAVEKQIAKLKNLGKLDRIGSDKSGIWKIIEKNENSNHRILRLCRDKLEK